MTTVRTLKDVTASERPYAVEVHFEQDGEYRVLFYAFRKANRAAIFRSVVAAGRWNVTTVLHQHIGGVWEEVEQFDTLV